MGGDGSTSVSLVELHPAEDVIRAEAPGFGPASHHIVIVNPKTLDKRMLQIR